MRNLSLALIAVLLLSSKAYACLACWQGIEHDPSSVALKWSMLTLFFVIIAVLIAFGAFFLNLRKRSKILAEK